MINLNKSVKAVLTKIAINSSNSFTIDELPKLQRFYHAAAFKTLDDFSYFYNKNTDEEKEAEHLKALELFTEYSKKESKELNGYTHEFLCDISLFLSSFPNTKFNVLGTSVVNVDMNNSDAIKLQQESIVDMIDTHSNKVNSMMSTFLKMSENIAENLKFETLNQKCDVHIGGGLLMTVNETLLLTDSCTDQLQTQLNNGWRILAVSVQPDSRRPDYVLGRYNSQMY
jgi:hypothetical protein